MPTNIWSYSGEAGKRLDGVVRPFVWADAGLEFHSMGVDRWTWSVPLKNFVATTEEYPEEGQLVTLYRNGQRFFRGVALRPDRNGYAMNIEVVGPWHWLETVQLTTDVALDAASGGGTGVRTTIGFASGQTMTANLVALIDRCIALGAPMIKGVIASTFAQLPITLNNEGCAGAIVSLARLIGDMSVWFDYATGSGHPIIHISRRLAGLAAGSSPDVSLDAANFTPGQFKLVPMDEIRVSQVRVPFINRKFDGTRLYQEQKAGTPEAGHVLILTASGKELDTFLPDEKLDSYNLQAVPTTGTAFRNWLINQEPDFIAAGQVAGTSPHLLPVVLGPQTFNYQTNSANLPATNTAIPVAGVSFVNQAGAAVSTSGKSILVSDTPPEWLKEQSGYVVEEIRITGAIAYEFKETTHSGTGGSNVTNHQVEPWWHAVRWDIIHAAGFRGNSTSNYLGYELFIHNFDVRAFLINAAGSSTIYRQPDYTFIAPPAGFASGLLAARNWRPYKGVCGWKEQDCGAVRYLGKNLNITGADAEFATMRAMVASEVLDLHSGATKLTVGPPARLGYRSLLDAVRLNPNEQIVYL